MSAEGMTKETAIALKPELDSKSKLSSSTPKSGERKRKRVPRPDVGTVEDVDSDASTSSASKRQKVAAISQEKDEKQDKVGKDHQRNQDQVMKKQNETPDCCDDNSVESSSATVCTFVVAAEASTTTDRGSDTNGNDEAGDDSEAIASVNTLCFGENTKEKDFDSSFGDECASREMRKKLMVVSKPVLGSSSEHERRGELQREDTPTTVDLGSQSEESDGDCMYEYSVCECGGLCLAGPDGSSDEGSEISQQSGSEGEEVAAEDSSGCCQGGHFKGGKEGEFLPPTGAWTVSVHSSMKGEGERGETAGERTCSLCNKAYCGECGLLQAEGSELEPGADDQDGDGSDAATCTEAAGAEAKVTDSSYKYLPPSLTGRCNVM